MNSFRSRVFSALIVLLLPSISNANAADVTEATTEQRFAAELAQEGLSESEVLAMLAKAHIQPSILEAIARPAETKSWKDYRPIFLTDRRIAEGVVFYREHRQLLDRVSHEFGVPAEIIVAIIGVETSYGRNTGKYRVLDALATLAFHYPPRQDFFRGELKQLFLLKAVHLPVPMDELKGSYAGAMGWGQFMPSSLARYSHDYDGDGTVDMWSSLPDIIASVANYFVAHGWETGGPVTGRAQPATNAREIHPANLEPVYPVSQLAAWGYAPVEHYDPLQLGTLLLLNGANGPEYWLTFRNFYVISRYNRSPLYSMAVWQLAQAIAQAIAETPK